MFRPLDSLGRARDRSVGSLELAAGVRLHGFYRATP